MHKEYPSFIYNNEKFIILPGTRFTKKEIMTRLHLMGINWNNNQDKLYLCNLYESSLKDNQNKLKIITQLRKDTDNLNIKLSNSIRPSLPPNIISTNISQNKVLNISQEVQPFYSNNPQYKIVQPIHTNKFQYTQNPFISENTSINKSNNNTFNVGISSNNNMNNFSLKSNNLSNINNNNNNSSFISSQEIHIRKNNDNSIISNNDNNQIFNPKVQEQINRDDSINSSQYIKCTKRYEEDEEDLKYNNILNNNYPNNKVSNRQNEEQNINNLGNENQKNNNKKLTYQENNNKNIMNNMSNMISININSNINYNRKAYTNMPNQSQYFENNQSMLERKNNLDNRKAYTNIHNNSQYSANNQNFMGNSNKLNNSNDANDNLKTYTNLPNDQYSENDQNIFNSKNNLNITPGFDNSTNLENPYKSNSNNSNSYNYNNPNISMTTQVKPNYTKGDNNLIVNNNIKEKEPDEVSTFSMFSNFKNNFKNLKNKPFYKNKKFICFHSLLLILILCFSIAILNFINYSWDSITNFFELLIHPVDLICTIGSFFTSLVLGAYNYYYLTIPLIIFAFIGFLYIKYYFFKKRIKEIFRKIKIDLMNNNNISNENRAISEDAIYERYVKKYKVSYKEFTKKYLPKLRKMREKDLNLKAFQKYINNKNVTFWELPLGQ